ncbi:hypothetical protein Hanom_Chr03g00279111 [Helianthus anomalus]
MWLGVGVLRWVFEELEEELAAVERWWRSIGITSGAADHGMVCGFERGMDQLKKASSIVRPCRQERKR